MQKLTKTIAALMLAIAVVCAAGCKKHNDGNGSYNGHDYIDLGLPSGTLWATCNVGADTPEGYGDHFAWGETQPKSYYEWTTYKYANGNHNTLTKYCNNSGYGYNGFTDNLTMLLAEDDAATTNWGNGWRMPTQEEWLELCQNTTNTWTTRNGVYGRLFTASNGNSLFLPAAGCRLGTSLTDDGSYGYYWSSSLHTDGPNSRARNLAFYSGRCYMFYNYRNYGFSVRAVRLRSKLSSTVRLLPHMKTFSVVRGFLITDAQLKRTIREIRMVQTIAKEKESCYAFKHPIGTT